MTVLLAAACGGDDASDGAGRYGSGTSDGSVSITAPAEGALVSRPVEVRMGADEFDVEAAGAVRNGAGHLHLMIDVECVEPGSVIPSDASHLHYGDGSTTAVLDLEPGEHTLCIQAGDGVHTALALTDGVTFTVAG